MDQIIRIRVRTAEKQAKRLSLFLSVGVTLLAKAGLGLSFWFGWLTADWIAGVLLLIGLDALFEAQLMPVDR